MMRARWLARLVKRVTDRKVTTEPDLVIGDNYLRRWFVIPRNRFFNIYLHEILRSDSDEALHDHPWWNVSFILDGQLLEVLSADRLENRYLNQGNIVARGAEALHRLEIRDGAVCRTLFITGARVREWGFQCPQGWRHWKEFTGFSETGDSTKVGRGCGEL